MVSTNWWEFYSKLWWSYHGRVVAAVLWKFAFGLYVMYSIFSIVLISNNLVPFYMRNPIISPKSSLSLFCFEEISLLGNRNNTRISLCQASKSEGGREFCITPKELTTRKIRLKQAHGLSSCLLSWPNGKNKKQKIKLKSLDQMHGKP